MEFPFKIGSVVIQGVGSMRMKVTAIDKESGRIRCSWTRGPAKFSKSFDPKDLMLSSAVVVPLPAVAPRR